MQCPRCQQAMEQGWLTIYDPTIFTKLVWQPVEPGYIRLRKPPGAVKVLQPRVGGGGSRKAFICKVCELTLFSYHDPEDVRDTF